MNLELTPIWYIVEKIVNSKKLLLNVNYTAILHTVVDDIEITKILTIDFERDYSANIADKIHLEFTTPLGAYVKDIYPYRRNLEITLYYRTTTSTKYERYKAIFLDDNRVFSGNEYSGVSKKDLDVADIETVKLQLVNRGVEPLMIKTTSGVYSNITMDNLLRAVISTESKKITVDGSPIINALNIVTPSNNKKIKNIIIPSDTLLITVPTMLQEQFNGVYSTGLGSYIQNYEGKLTWFIYPLYSTQRFTSSLNKIIFYNIPKNRFPNIEHTYLKTGTITHVLCTSEVVIEDNREKSERKNVTGLKLSFGASFMKKPIVMSKSGPIANSRLLNTAFTAYNSSDQLTFAKYGDKNISINLFSQTSRMAASMGSKIDVVWENSDRYLIYPGMPCMFMFFKDGLMIKRTGIILFVHHLIQLDGEGSTSNNYKTTSLISMYTKMPEGEQ